MIQHSFKYDVAILENLFKISAERWAHIVKLVQKKNIYPNKLVMIIRLFILDKDMIVNFVNYPDKIKDNP